MQNERKRKSRAKKKEALLAMISTSPAEPTSKEISDSQSPSDSNRERRAETVVEDSGKQSVR